MTWTVEFHSAFSDEFDELDLQVREKMVAYLKLLEAYGPHLGRPHADTLKDSKFNNMKELRFKAANGVWRAAYAFDEERRAIVLVAGDKAGVKETRFYKKLIATADKRFEEHLNGKVSESNVSTLKLK